MRTLSCALLLLVLAAVLEPIAAAASQDPRPPCCRGMGAVCCLPDASGAWKSCPGTQSDNPPSNLTVFSLPVVKGLNEPSFLDASQILRIARADAPPPAQPDPPPRA